MNLLDELVLLAYDDEGRRIIDGGSLDYALAGALLVELALAERVGVENGRVVVLNTTPVDDGGLVTQALNRISADGRDRKPGHWVRKLSQGVRQPVLDHLVAAEVLRVVHSRVMIVFPRTRYPAVHGVEPIAETEARGRMRAALEGTGPVEPRTGALCALVAATGSERKIFPEMDRKLLRARLEEISEGEWAAEAVHRTIRDVQMAVAAAVVVTDGGGGDGGGGDGGGGGGS